MRPLGGALIETAQSHRTKGPVPTVWWLRGEVRGPVPAYAIAIVEDEDDAATTLRDYLGRYATEHDEAFDVTRFSSGLEFECTHARFDLIFMDIQIPGVNGMEAAQLLREHDDQTPLVFVTNLAQYAVRGYEVDALDFILKPVSYPNFRMRMDKAMRHVRRNASRSIAVGGRDDLRVLAVRDIEYVEVSRHDVSYHLVDEEEPLVAYGSLKATEAELEGAPFVRVSNSCLVNMAHIRQVKDGAIRMRGGGTLWFSRSRKREATATITSYFGGSI